VKYSDEFENEEGKKAGSKGFYIALAVCLIAICGVAVTTFVSSLPTDEPDNVDATKGSATATTTSVQQVVIPATSSVLTLVPRSFSLKNFSIHLSSLVCGFLIYAPIIPHFFTFFTIFLQIL